MARAIGIGRNVGPGRITVESLTGTAKFRVPDFGPQATIARRGSIVEVKNVARLKMTPQLWDLIEQVRVARLRDPKIVLEVFTNGAIPTRGKLARLLTPRPGERPLIVVRSIP